MARNNNSILPLSIWFHCLSKQINLLMRNICAAEKRRQLVLCQWSDSQCSSWTQRKHVNVNNEQRSTVLYCITAFYLLKLENTYQIGILDKDLLSKVLWIQYVCSFSQQVDAKIVAKTKLIGVPTPGISHSTALFLLLAYLSFLHFKVICPVLAHEELQLEHLGLSTVGSPCFRARHGTWWLEGSGGLLKY